MPTIKGTPNMRRAFLLVMEDNQSATRFGYEQNMMFSQREIELIQKYLKVHGEIPDRGVDDLHLS